MPLADITGVILAGGRARRMDGIDKGLATLAGKPLVEYVIDTLRPQVGRLLISANRNLDRYRRYNLPVVADSDADFRGPLAGVAAALQLCETPLLLVVPCDMPRLPNDLARHLYEALRASDADVAFVHDGKRMQPLCALLQRKLLPSLLDYLNAGGRRVDAWYAQLQTRAVDFSACPACFANINTADERERLQARLIQQARDE